MALTKSSVLHYWSSRYGINPRVGGRPVFTRNSAGAFVTQEGEVDSAIVNTPRFAWATLQLPGSQTERRKVLTLEQARTNRTLYATNMLNGVWVPTTMGVVAGIDDPAGGSSAFKLTATGTNAQLDNSSAGLASLVRIASLWIRARSVTGLIRLLRPDGSSWVTVAPTSLWQRFSALATGAYTSAFCRVRIDTNGDLVDVWQGQAEEGSVLSSEIFTTSAAVARARDSLSWTFPPVPQALMMYIHFIERGTTKDTVGQGLIAIGDGPEYFTVYSAANGWYRTYHYNGTTETWSDLNTSPVSPGSTVEIVAILHSNGGVSIHQSINGAAVTSAGPSGAATLTAAWSSGQLFLNAKGSSNPGIADFAEVKVVKYADVVASTGQGIMDEMRAFELGPNGDVL